MIKKLTFLTFLFATNFAFGQQLQKQADQPDRTVKVSKTETVTQGVLFTSKASLYDLEGATKIPAKHIVPDEVIAAEIEGIKTQLEKATDPAKRELISKKLISLEARRKYLKENNLN